MNFSKENKKQGDYRLAEQIRRGDKNALEALFFEYYQDLCAYALRMVKSKEQAEDIVQDVFYNLWERRKECQIHVSFKAYLFQSVRNQTLNCIRKSRHYRSLRDEFAQDGNWMSDMSNGVNQIDHNLVKRIWAAVHELPPRRKSVFVLHQKHGLSYREIAEVLNIKRKTVENHMGFALNEIRERIDFGLLPVSSS